MRVNRGVYVAASAVVCLLVASHGSVARAQGQGTAAVIKQVEVSNRQGAPVLQVTADGALDLRTSRLTAPDRLVLDFAHARIGVAHGEGATPAGPVRGVRIGQFQPDVARIVVDLDSAAPFQVQAGQNSVTIVFAPGGASATLVPTRGSPGHPGLNAAVAKSSRANAPAAAAATSAPAAPVTTAPAAATALAAAEPIVSAPNSFAGGMLTFAAKDQTLETVLDDIGGLANLPIVLGDGVGGEHVSVQLRGFRLDEALRQVLKDYDFIFSYSNEGEDRSLTLNTVWVYPPNQGPGIARLAMTAWSASAREYQQATTATDPDDRAHAVDQLIRRDGRGAVNTVLNALKDPSDKVRYQALYRATLMGALPPEDTIIDLVLNDASEQVKIWAFQTLPLDPTLRWVALRASGDANQQLATLARNYISDLDASLGVTGGTVTTQTAPSGGPAQAEPEAQVFPSATVDTPAPTVDRRGIAQGP